jgi:hypothetical protein
MMYVLGGLKYSAELNACNFRVWKVCMDSLFEAAS